MNQLSRTIILSALFALFHFCWARMPLQAQDVASLDRANAIVQVVEGATHACALTAEGKVLCWGERWRLQGVAFGEQLFPVPVSGITETIQSLTAGAYHTCGVTQQKQAICWGWNNYGVLGDEQTTKQALVRVTTISETIQMMALGNLHTCALTVSGGVKCWGWNHEGELGNGDVKNSVAAVDVVGLSAGVSMITSGSTHTCALTTTNDVYCWGENQYGQLGDGEISESRTTPIKVQELSDIYSISAGGRHTCALLKTNQVKCWGRNEKGQLGDGTNVTSSTVPVDVVGLSTVQEIATYANHSCARLLDGSMRCWGSNDYGRLGDGTQFSRNIPVAVVGLGGPVANLGEGGAFNIAGDKYGGEFTCAVLVNGNAQCWGYNSYNDHLKFSIEA